ncbi:MAG: hypothetical protein JWN61_3278 [Pseudonocardiales bacterium]|nr:hypothetical protein [Pseudonocardiales bacterium]
MTAAARTDALLARVADQLRNEPDRIRPILELLVDPDALPTGEDERAEVAATARRINRARQAQLSAAFVSDSLSTEDVRALLGGISRQAVSERVRSGRLLGARLGATLRMPAWQFGPDGVVAGLPRVLAVLATRGSAVAAQAWMRTPIPDEGGRSAADLVIDGELDLALHYLHAAAH